MSRQTPTSLCAENRAALPKALFAPTLICAALLAALPAEALRTGGSTISPSSDSWGYTTPTKGNSIEFTDETATVVIFGAYAKVDGETASASENSVTLTRSPLDSSGAYGGYARINASTETDPTEIPSAGQGDASVKSNHVTLREGSKLKAAFGGTAEVYTLGGGEAEAIDNTVSLSGNSFSEEIQGGFAGIASHGDFSAFANSNTVSLSNSSTRIVHGGWASAGTTEANEIRLEANNNRVTLTNSTANESNGSASSVIGGQSYLEAGGYNSATVQANSNQVELIDSQCLGAVAGGYSLTYTLLGTTVEALDNRVTLSGNSMAGAVFGGIITNNTVTVAGNEDDSQATVSRNHIELSDTAKATTAYGGGAEVYVNQDTGKASAFAKNNTASFKGNAETESVYAGEARAYYGQSARADASENEVTFEGSAIASEEAYGGRAFAQGNKSGLATANKNSVTLKESSQAKKLGGGYAEAFDSSVENTARAHENGIALSGNALIETASGGISMAVGGESASAEARGNTITLSDHALATGELEGGNADARDAENNIATAALNSVTLEGEAHASNGIYGGKAYTLGLENAKTALALAQENTVTLSGQAHASWITGGCAESVRESGSVATEAHATGNKISLSGEASLLDSGRLWGGMAGARLAASANTATASQNYVTLAGNVQGVFQAVGGDANAYSEESGASNSALADNNTLELTENAVADYLTGGQAATSSGESALSSATGNTVSLEGSARVTGRLLGGSASASDATKNTSATSSENKVFLSGSTAANSITVGRADAQSNAVNKATASDNIASLSESAENEALYGGVASARDGLSNTSEALRNILLVSELAQTEWVEAGYAEVEGENSVESVNTALANENTLSISSNAQIAGAIGGDASAYVGKLNKAEASGNVLSLAGRSLVTRALQSGTAISANGENNSAEASRNAVILSGDAGVDADAKTLGGSATASSNIQTSINMATANENSIFLSGKAEIRSYATVGGETYAANGAQNTASASFNTVTIGGESRVYGVVVGGEAAAFVSEDRPEAGLCSATADGNTLLITENAQVLEDTTLVGGDAIAAGQAAASASGNRVVINGAAQVAGHIIGGSVTIHGTSIRSAVANDNVILIDGATLSGDRQMIAGGEVYVANDTLPHEAIRNTVTLTGNFSLQPNAWLFGGLANYREEAHPALSTGDLFTGNVLNLDVRKAGPLQVAGVGNFETINIQAGEVKAGDTVLEAAGAFLGNGKAGDAEKGTTVNLLSIKGKALKPGDRITLITNVQEGGRLANQGEVQHIAREESFATDYRFLIDLTEGAESEKDVTATLLTYDLNPETKIFAENRAASLALLSGGADILDDADIGKGRNLFGVIQGGHSRYSTGSHVEVDGVHLATGLANTWSLAKGDLTGAAFIEAGWGDTDTYNSIGGKSLHGSGDSHYYGVDAPCPPIAARH